MPCSGRCGERHCPTCCLCCEVLSPHSLLPSSAPYYDVFLKYMLRCIFELVLCFVQVFCCFGPSVSSTRYIIQDEFNIKTTGCDNCIIVSFYLSLAVCVYVLCLQLFLCLQFQISHFNMAFDLLQGCMVCLQQVACICNILACLTGSGEINDIAECLSCIAESVYCS